MPTKYVAPQSGPGLGDPTLVRMVAEGITCISDLRVIYAGGSSSERTLYEGSKQPPSSRLAPGG